MKYSDFRSDYPYRCAKGNDNFQIGDIITISSDNGDCNVFCVGGGWYDKEECKSLDLFSDAIFEPAREYVTSDNGREIIHKSIMTKYVMWEETERGTND